MKNGFITLFLCMLIVSSPIASASCIEKEGVMKGAAKEKQIMDEFIANLRTTVPGITDEQIKGIIDYNFGGEYSVLTKKVLDELEAGLKTKNIEEIGDSEKVSVLLETTSGSELEQKLNELAAEKISLKDTSVRRGFSDLEALLIYQKNEDVAKNLLLRVTSGESPSGVGWGYAHALKHKIEFEKYGGLDNVLNDVITKPDLEFTSRGKKLEIYKIKDMETGQDEFVITVFDQSENLVTLYTAVEKTAEEVGRKSILATFEDMARNKNLQLYTPQQGSDIQDDMYIEVKSEADDVKVIHYSKQGDTVSIKAENLAKSEFDGLIASDFQKASNTKLKRRTLFTNYRRGYANVDLDLSGLIKKEAPKSLEELVDARSIEDVSSPELVNKLGVFLSPTAAANIKTTLEGKFQMTSDDVRELVSVYEIANYRLAADKTGKAEELGIDLKGKRDATIERRAVAEELIDRVTIKALDAGATASELEMFRRTERDVFAEVETKPSEIHKDVQEAIETEGSQSAIEIEAQQTIAKIEEKLPELKGNLNYDIVDGKPRVFEITKEGIMVIYGESPFKGAEGFWVHMGEWETLSEKIKNPTASCGV